MLKPRTKMIAFLAFVLLLTLAACNNVPETQVFIVLTPTHQPATLTALANAGNPVTPAPGETEPAVEGTIEGFPTAMPTAPPMPTALVSQIQVAEQQFENGRMFWLQPTQEIWVLVNASGATDHGQWLVFEDLFVEGEVEIDPELTPPASLIQPRRGFGKLWRTNPELRDAVGWALTPEFGFVTNYEYRPGGYLDSTGKYVPGPGVHVLNSLGNQAFAIEERDNTWRLLE